MTRTTKIQIFNTFKTFFYALSGRRIQPGGDKLCIHEIPELCETETQVARADVPDGCNVMNSHTIYNFKVNDERTLFRKP